MKNNSANDTLNYALRRLYSISKKHKSIYLSMVEGTELEYIPCDNDLIDLATNVGIRDDSEEIKDVLFLRKWRQDKVILLSNLSATIGVTDSYINNIKDWINGKDKDRVLIHFIEDIFGHILYVDKELNLQLETK